MNRVPWKCELCGTGPFMVDPDAGPVRHVCRPPGAPLELISPMVVGCCEPPPLAEQVVDFAVISARHTANGFKLLTAPEVEARYAVCLTCPYLADAKNRCNVCGCKISGAVSQKNAAAWQVKDCPKGFWPARK